MLHVYGEKLVPSNVDGVRIRLAACEQRDLEAGDVPVFRTQPGPLAIVDSVGTEFPQCLLISSLDCTFHRLRGLGHVDMAQQLYLLRSSMATKQLDPIPGQDNTQGDSRISTESTRARRADLIEAAAAIGRRLEELAHRHRLIPGSELRT
jgi:class II lanthipeptide synthase